MKKYILLFLTFFFLLASKKSSSQVSEDTFKKTSSAIGGAYFYGQGSYFFDMPRFKNHAYAFGVAIYISKTGKVDSVIFTNQTKLLDSLVSFDKIRIELKKRQKNIYLDYKNTVLIATVFLRRSWDNLIVNPDLLEKQLYSVIPVLANHGLNKKIRIMPTISFVTVKPKHK